MFSQTVEYALRAVVHLAALPGEPQTAQQIAVRTKVPAPYLSKVLQHLARAGLVTSQRGIHGGFALNIPAERLTIFQVVQAVDPICRIETCPLGLEAHGVNLCPLHRRMDDALAQVEGALRATTLAEVLSEPTKSTPLGSL
jgi:Rrf2 family transcriptional regulator, nitric oxide-sensitive transcriptional repressor